MLFINVFLKDYDLFIFCLKKNYIFKLKAREYTELAWKCNTLEFRCLNL